MKNHSNGNKENLQPFLKSKAPKLKDILQKP